MSVSYAPTKLRVPLGFEHLLEALAREVLREQPKDIIDFAAEYFRRKLVLRDEGTLDSIITASEKSTTTKSEDVPPKEAQPSVEQDVTSTEQPEAIDIDLSDPEVQKAASAIQMRFRSHFKRGKATKNQEEAQPEVVDDKEVSEQAQSELSNLDLDDPELNKAASVIQSNFRTYLSEKNKTTEHTETQKESEGVGDDAEPATSHTAEDPDLTVAESTTDKIIPETEESKFNTDEQVPPAAVVPEETEGKGESIPEPSSPENQDKVEKELEGDSKEALPSEPVADAEPQPTKTEGEGATSKEAEAQAEGSGESGESPETNEETKGEEDSGGDGGDGDVGEGGDGGEGGEGGDGGDGGDGGGEEDPADKDPAVATEQQVEATAGDVEKQEEGAPEGGEATVAGDSKEAPSDEAS